MTTPRDAAGDVTELLTRWSNGDEEALQRLMPLVYSECRRIAERQMSGERAEHTLSPTALVNELYLRLVDQRRAVWKDRAHFFGMAAQLMRRILVDHARAQLAAKRGGGRVLVSLESLDIATDQLDQSERAAASDVLALDEALVRLGARDPDQQRIVELRFFAGLTVEETAHVLGRSSRTIKREWRLAKAWLFRELHDGAA